MTVFFSQVGYKPTREWKEEIIVFDPRKGRDAPDGESAAKSPPPAAVELAVASGTAAADWTDVRWSDRIVIGSVHD